MPFLIMFLLVWALSIGATLSAINAENLVATTGYGLLSVGVAIIISRMLDKEIK